ncbi:ABC transporter permease subunit [Pullulanibacillus sp. KACC 23026]|uniref:ABC transporter permease n=1 Tax=Pullulanibacillus sp. KACC 23026 TaxID=3028315 RepID=UPI0023B1B444|nr:ABC transporter permease subunit [Pullulanibacillus sp. KACC 23026]WEG15013.1 ABC transporter permease subunit [Pullulanibacillus sp. KACC 23026]
MTADKSVLSKTKKNSVWKRLTKQKYPQLFVILGLIALFIFQYMPMFGILMAFKDYSITDGIRGIFTDKWAGLKYFKEFFTDYQFKRILINTLAISILKLIFTFPVPILLALMINEVRNKVFKKVVQSTSYFPHFISWVVVAGLASVFLSADSGLLNNLLIGLHIIHKPIGFLSSPNYFWGLAVGTAIWKEAGWWTIIFLAAISGIDPGLYEAAQIDGAGRLRRIWHITLPAIRGTIIVVLILAIGSLLGGGLVGSNFEQSFLLGNSVNSDRSQILQTYAFNMGLAQGRYSYATAIDLLQSIISVILIFGSNWLAKKTTKTGLF